METPEFAAGIQSLFELAEDRRTVIMCAEAVWWRCHRSLISDFLKAEGATVIHIVDAIKVEEHPYTGVARIVEGQLSYRGLFDEGLASAEQAKAKP